MRSRRTVFALAAVVALVAASNASGDEIDGYTATGTPTLVKASTSTNFMISLTNKASSDREADTAKIGIPDGFAVDAASVKATTTAVVGEECVVSTWVADGTLIDDDKINLKRPGSSDTRLCRGATLKVEFSATSTSLPGTYTWTTELHRGDDTFVLDGAQPTVVVEATPIDTTGPSTVITEKPADPTNSRSASFVFSASEQATFECKLDDGAFVLCVSPQHYTNLSEGRHTFTVRARDAALNLGEEAAYSWTIDLRAPAIEVTSAPGELTNSRSASFSFAADEPATFQCSLEGGAYEPCSSPAAYGALGDGGHAFSVRASDAAGNTSAASRSWAVDATAPETRLDSRPAAATTATSARFTFSASEAASFECRLDGAAFAPCASPLAYSRLRLGRHRFEVRAIDAARNVDATPVRLEWTVRRATRRVAASALFAPAAGSRVTRPPLLRWRPVARASYYNVQLYRGGRKILTVWPTRTQLRLQGQWRFNGKVERLRPGLYRWYVWPGYGRTAARRYGRLVGSSTFVVAAATR